MPVFQAKLVKWGDRMAVRIPKAVVEQAGLREGDEIQIRVAKGRITLVVPKQKLTLESLVARITPRNRYRERNWGKAVGKEVW